MSYYIYLILAVSCFIAEIFSMEFSLICFGIGLLGASLTSWLGGGLWWQVIVFIIVSSALWISIRPIALKHFYKNSQHIKTPAEEIIGKEGFVEEDIDPVKHTGRVKVAGESWKATAKQPLSKGTLCRVENLEGVTVTVKEK